MITFLLTRNRGAIFSLLAAVGVSLAPGGAEADTPDPSVTLGPWARHLKVGPRMNAAGSDLRGSQFIGQGLKGAVFDGCDLHNVFFWDCSLSGASFRGAHLSDMRFEDCPSITEADFTDAVVVDLYVDDFFLSPDQLMSTRSYKNKDLHGCSISGSSGGRSSDAKPAYDFRAANLSGARLRHGDFSACDFTDATIDRITIEGCRMTLKQLASTKNFKQRNLSHMRFGVRLDQDADFSGQNLTRCRFEDCDLAGAKLDDAVLSDAHVTTFLKRDTHVTLDQIRSTWNYKHGRMDGIELPKAIADALKAK